jgi:flagellar hook-associated protein 1
MSGLSTALSQALSGLVVSQSQTAVVSRNITRAADEDYTRKSLGLTTDFAGNARAANISRVVEQKLTDAVSTSKTTMSGQQVLSDALQTLSETIGDVEADGSIAWGIGQLQVALTDYEATPGSTTAGNNAVAVAGRLAQSLNDASGIVSNLRQQSDSGIAASVSNSNRILAEIEDINGQITSAGNDSGTVAELLDKRDAAIKRLSEEMGVRTVQRPNNGIAVYTESGVTLFDVKARSITFNPTSSLPPGSAGNPVFIDGVQVTGTGAPMPLRQGRIAAQVEVRDTLTTGYQSQLDEVARGLITQFSESDQGALPSLPDGTGLFSYTGSPAVPAAATLYPGLASEIKINSAFDPTQGGSSALLRDGGSNGAAYVYNTTGVSGFQDRLSALISGLDSPATFDPSSGLDPNANLKTFASLSAGWIEQKRSEGDRKLETVEASYQRATDALAKKSGVNIDEEMATLLNLEKSYQASAKIMSTVDQMMATLMDIVR